MSASSTPDLWRQLLPQWPVVSRQFWLTVALLSVAVLNLVFFDEIWPHTPEAAPVCRAIALLAAGAMSFEGLRIMWRWAAAYPGPRWAAVLFRLCMTATVYGLAVFGTLGFIAAALFLI